MVSGAGFNWGDMPQRTSFKVSDLKRIYPATADGDNGPRMVKTTREIPTFEPPSAEDRTEALRRQNAVEAHTIFSVNDTVIGVQWADNTTALVHDYGPAAQVLRANQGIDAADRRAELIEDALRQMYGPALKVHTFEDGQAPTRGAMNDVMWHGASLEKLLEARTQGGPPRSLLSMDYRTLGLFNSADS